MKCNLKIYHHIRKDSIDIENNKPIQQIQQIQQIPPIHSNISDKITEVDFVFTNFDTINMLKDYVSKFLNISPIFIHIYFDEEKINDSRPTPYRLSNGLLLWNVPAKNSTFNFNFKKADLSKIGFKSKIDKGWSASLPIEIKLEHLHNCNIFDYIAIVEV